MAKIYWYPTFGEAFSLTFWEMQGISSHHWRAPLTKSQKDRSHAGGLCCVCVHTCMCTCVWRPHVHIRCFPLSLSTPPFKAGSLMEQSSPGSHTGQPVSSRDLPVSTPPAAVYHACLPVSVPCLRACAVHPTHWAVCLSSRLCFDLLLCKISNHRGRKQGNQYQLYRLPPAK